MMAFMMNTHPHRKQYSKEFRPADFMPHFTTPRKKSPNEVYALFRTWAMLNGAKQAESAERKT